MKQVRVQLILLFSFLLGFAGPHVAAKDPLPSWHDGKTKDDIQEFVSSVTNPTGPHYLQPEQRIAVFDNDGTLLTEKPQYMQVAFCYARIREMVKHDPELAQTQPYKAIAEDDQAFLETASSRDLFNATLVANGGTTSQAYNEMVQKWLKTDTHPNSGKLHTDLIYQPMVELLIFLRANGFKTYICTGSDVDFVRNFSQTAYGVPPEQIIGSSMDYELKETPEGPVIHRKTTLNYFNNKNNKPLNIQRIIGRRPVFAAGNSDGDLAMLQFADHGTGPSFKLLVRHDDANREYAYDKGAEKAHAMAKEKNWHVVSMEKDFKRIYPHSPNRQKPGSSE